LNTRTAEWPHPPAAGRDTQASRQLAERIAALCDRSPDHGSPVTQAPASTTDRRYASPGRASSGEHQSSGGPAPTGREVKTEALVVLGMASSNAMNSTFTGLFSEIEDTTIAR